MGHLTALWELSIYDHGSERSTLYSVENNKRAEKFETRVRHGGVSP